MVSRSVSRTRSILLLIVSAIMVWLAVTPAVAAMRDYPTQDLEGDPGDGVLEPSSRETFDTSGRLPWQPVHPVSPGDKYLDFVLLPVNTVPGLPGLIIFRIVRIGELAAWRHVEGEGRWPYAP